MSLISDALKTSQREKDRRASVANPPAPFMVPLRAKPRSEFSLRNSLTIGVSLAVIAGSGYAIYYRMFRPSTRPLAATTVPPIASIDVAAADSSRVVQAAASAEAPPVASASRADSVQRIAAAPPRVRPAPRVVRRDTAPVVLQNRPAQAAAPAVAAPVQSAPSGGRLRISVEQPRGYEVARIFATGVAAHRAGDLDAAREAYERVLLLAPNDVDALNNLGVLLGAQREYERAEQVLRRAVRLAPRNASAWNNLGTVLAQRGQAGEAIAAFQEALRNDPLSTAARVSLAQQHLAIGSPGRARELLEEAIVGNPSLPEAHYTLGQAYEMQKDWPGAIRAYNSFIRVAPPRLAPQIDLVRRRVEALTARVK